MRVEYRVLGPLEVLDHDEPLAIGGTKQRALLAILLLNANAVLSSDRLIDELWGAEAPKTAARSLQVLLHLDPHWIGRSPILERRSLAPVIVEASVNVRR